MTKIEIETQYKKILSDVYTPEGIYLRLRDRVRDTISLESADHHSAENSFSYIGINAIAGIEITNYNEIELNYPKQNHEKKEINDSVNVPALLWNFMQKFQVNVIDDKQAKTAQGL